MSRVHLLFPRAAGLIAASAVLAAAAVLGSAPASAHVHVDADDPVRGDSATLTFRVPNESETGSPTTGLTVTLPDLTSVSTAVTPGWTAALDRDTAAGTVRSVTWKASQGNGIGSSQFGLFVLRVKLPDAATVSFPATQTYADGTVVHWDQPEPSGGPEPEHPVPMLALDAAAGHDEGAGEEPRAQADTVARALAGGALLVAAVGTGIAVLRRRA